ncbi:hypothetical protein [Mesorhizobium sp.]|uniref:hypothetical protein n=1 Tax=Mesorhizobium sp. TaxID=1871066 RepID=UPI0025D45292|nr:hypothetical protein [Mesorhizobium sp.]
MDHMTAVHVTSASAARRWLMLSVVSVGAFLPMTTWFSATAIAPQLTRLWTFLRLRERG